MRKSGSWDREFLSGLFHLIAGYWKSDERRSAFLYLFAIAALTIAAVYMTLLLNDWYNSFYSALQNYDTDALWHGILLFTGLAFAHIVFAVYASYLQQLLSLRWRRWMTEAYLTKWTEGDRYYRMEMFSRESDNPDQRISEDIDTFTSQTLSFLMGLLRAMTTIICFIFVLWELSEPISFTLFGETFTVGGYLVWTAIVYSIAGTWVTHYVGHRLVGLNFKQQRLEADFRFGMVRLREAAESVAFYAGAKSERALLSKRFALVLANTYLIVKKQKQLSWLTNGYMQVAIIFPLVVALPRYLLKEISLGGLMQIANCFGRVQDSMSYFVEVYTSLAAWQSCAERLLTFDAHIRELSAAQEKEPLVKETAAHDLRLAGVSVKLPSGAPLLSDVNLLIRDGEHVLLKGASGSGKSTLLRALAGLWPYASGKVTGPSPSVSMFIPQRPYMPMGTLREAAAYPGEGATDEALLPLLSAAGLSHLAPRLDEEADWSHVLSLGEQQRLAFVRIFLRRPKWVFLDEATSAMDEDREAKLYEMLTNLPETAVLSVGHRSTLAIWHERTIRIEEGRLK